MRLQKKMQGIMNATSRYPLTMIFLLVLVFVNMFAINNDIADYLPLTFTLIIGALLGGVAQQVYERFFIKAHTRLLLMAGATVLTIGYYFMIAEKTGYSIETSAKTSVTVLALTMAFVWVPSIKQTVTFSNSFMVVFKSYFTTVLFTIVIISGLSLIVTAVDLLLISLHHLTIPHLFNLVVSLFAPIFFLSFIPAYLGKKDDQLPTTERTKREERVEIATRRSKNLEILISYIVIPLTAVYTLILLVYIMLNLGGDVWTESLLEPLLISYAIVVLFVYILSIDFTNKFAVYFKKIFPKALLPIVLFQTIASIIKISDMGVTHGRYYVILFGIFAIIISVVFSFLSVKKTGWIAPILIAFAIISIVPPVDAFTVSRISQERLLEQTLEDNNMLQNGEIISNETVSIKDQVLITLTVSYLDQMNYVSEIEWLPANAVAYRNFTNTFGFEARYQVNDQSPSQGLNNSQYAYLDREDDLIISVDDYDWMLHQSIYGNERRKEIELSDSDGQGYLLVREITDDFFALVLVDANNNTLIELDGLEIVNEIFDANESNGNRQNLTIDQATLIRENEQVSMKIIVENVNVYNESYNIDFYLFIDLK